tara:strand:+ start:943 stop:1182 length:240 start_codon:yes stop_codon:yes gene_type:complete
MIVQLTAHFVAIKFSAGGDEMDEAKTLPIMTMERRHKRCHSVGGALDPVQQVQQMKTPEYLINGDCPPLKTTLVHDERS